MSRGQIKTILILNRASSRSGLMNKVPPKTQTKNNPLPCGKAEQHVQQSDHSAWLHAARRSLGHKSLFASFSSEKEESHFLSKTTQLTPRLAPRHASMRAKPIVAQTARRAAGISRGRCVPTRLPMRSIQTRCSTSFQNFTRPALIRDWFQARDQTVPGA
jgi:hypothetical protein